MAHFFVIVWLIRGDLEVVWLLVPEEGRFYCIDAWYFECVEEDFASSEVASSSEAIISVVEAGVIFADEHGEGLDSVADGG